MGFRFKEQHTSNYKLMLKEHPKIPLTPEIRDHYESVSGQHGSYLFPQPFGDRTITVVCQLLADSREERTRLVMDIAGWLYSVGREVLVFDNEPNIFFRGKVVSQIDLDSTITTGVFNITFRCEPFKYGNEKESVEQLATDGSYMEFQAEGTTDIFPLIEIEAIEGIISNPSINVNGFLMQYNGYIPNDGKIIINSKDFTVITNNLNDTNMTGAVDLNNNSVLSRLKGSFPILRGGINSLSYTSGNKAIAKITISWQPTYI